MYIFLFATYYLFCIFDFNLKTIILKQIKINQIFWLKKKLLLLPVFLWMLDEMQIIKKSNKQSIS